MFDIVDILVIPEYTFYMDAASIHALILRQQLVEFTFKICLSTMREKLINIFDLIPFGNNMYPASFLLVLADLLALALLLLTSVNVFLRLLKRVEI